uniref:SAM domain-containing protein n=1 Tax=Steinernema glaseri TaxID=37863 RepID=A0A1I8AAN1_9BILA
MQLKSSGILFCLLLVLVHASSEKLPITRNVVITAEEERLRDVEGFNAIKELHRLMDDDHSGSIDRAESADFLKEDMNLRGSDRARREKAFHHNNDDSITVEDLWEAWFESDERSWGEREVVDWLTNIVGLPQYANNFMAAKVTGIALPRLAVQNSSYLSTVLGVTKSVHRQKIQLKALDLVIFGFRDSSSRAKDILLAILTVVLITILVVFKKHRNRSNIQMTELSTKLTQLKDMESDFQGMQQRFEEERKKRQSISPTSESKEELENLKSQLMEAERRLEMNSNMAGESLPLALQPLLKRTCELEMSYVSQQRLECIGEMREAIELVDKLKRKQSSFVSSIKLATGASSGTDEVDSKIFALKTRMDKIMMAMDECYQRWVEIENMCGFQLTGQIDSLSSTSRLPRVASAASFYTQHHVVPSGVPTGLNSNNSTVTSASNHAIKKMSTSVLHPNGTDSSPIVPKKAITVHSANPNAQGMSTTLSDSSFDLLAMTKTPPYCEPTIIVNSVDSSSSGQSSESAPTSSATLTPIKPEKKRSKFVNLFKRRKE